MQYDDLYEDELLAAEEDLSRRVSTGLHGLDQLIDELRLGDNVVWNVDSLLEYNKIVKYYVKQALLDNRHLVYIRFGDHDPLLHDPRIPTYHLDASKGFEAFTSQLCNLIKREGPETFYVFDCLTELLKFWYSDLTIGNFFWVICPYLYRMDTIAYFSLIKDSHSDVTIDRIRETTQLSVDLFHSGGALFVHPKKVMGRHSKNMFLPHRLNLVKDKAQALTSSSELAPIYSRFHINENTADYWDMTFHEAYIRLSGSYKEQENAKELLVRLLLSDEDRMYDLCCRYFNLRDLLNIKYREIGTGRIGEKSLGMLLARKILITEGGNQFDYNIEAHDSFYVGVDVYYTYIVHNNCWFLHMRQKQKEHYFRCGEELQDRILHGKFPLYFKRQFVRVLEHFGQSPIIVRSSSLLEDSFGNAFAGKYDSVFLSNQGTPEERLEAFENAIKHVYASMMNHDALAYRMNRNLYDKDEQMALLIQRVSGDTYGKYFFPHLAGVGNSKNMYVWNKDMDIDAGMIRLVFGLGTRAVDRIINDYPRIVCLDHPGDWPLVTFGDEKKFSQHYIDVLDLEKAQTSYITLKDMMNLDIKADASLFAETDQTAMRWLRETGRKGPVPHILSFRKLLTKTDFPATMQTMLKTLSKTYNYPVDIEFTVNFSPDGDYKINILQCRPQQVKGIGRKVEIPLLTSMDKCIFYTEGNFMGGNVTYPIDYVIYVKPKEYLALSEPDRYGVARAIGDLNQALKEDYSLLIGPGRWGTSTTALGVPVNFSDICNMNAICEVSYQALNLMPELSYGSHFFQDLVETDIFYIALFHGHRNVIFNEPFILEQPNEKASITDDKYEDVIKVIHLNDMELYSDTISQRAVCMKKPGTEV
ncbi:MAG: PEP/pyruvate-binding domain-containing protein [Lachnospiraceae bacterium]|nr:PEP/pyruvate-binding domain-containing protein [Lachnospiraceae bacterium]